MPSIELQEFYERGISYIPEIGERNFIPWRSFGIITAIGGL
jgi:hypothetical protein